MALLFVPEMRAPFLRDRFISVPVAAILHLAGSAIALAIGPFQLNSRLRKKIESVGYVNTIIGRKNPVNKDKAYVGLNALIQGSAADIMKQGLVNVDTAVRDLGGTALLVVHDEVVVEVPTEYAEECARRMEQALTSAYPLNPPLSVEGGVVHDNYANA